MKLTEKGVIVLALTKEEIKNRYNLDNLIAKLLYKRDMTDKEELELFLNGDFDDLHNPTGIPNIKEIAKNIRASLLFGDKVVIFGDYDVDGTSSTALLYRALSRVGSNINLDWMVSNRYRDGYGLSKEAIDIMVDEKDADMIITLDCGISDNENIFYAQEKGVEVIVVDHHENDGELPDCDFLDLKVEQGDYPFKSLCGCGITWKLAQVVLDDELYDLLDIVAMATIADVVPLKGENRLIVKEGLDKIRSGEVNLGIQDLIERNEIQNEDLKSYHFGFNICPMINASGRIGSAKKPVELMIEDYEMKVSTLGFKLRQDNEERKRLSNNALDDALDKADGDSNIVIYKGEMIKGIVGLVAGDLQEKFHKPTIVFGGEDEEGNLKGSCRSIEPLNMYELLQACEDLLANYGGHKMAAGLSLPKENYEEFVKRVKGLTKGIKYKKVKPDLEIEPDKLSMALTKEIDKLAPFGRSNPKPKFITKEIRAEDVKTVGSSNNHLKFKIDGIDAIGFKMGDKLNLVESNNIDVIYQPDINDYYGKSLQFKVKKIRPTNESNIQQQKLF